ncbi:hypothetical protein VD0002_g3455 [Verticillium dahliae]|uniref:Uncharacterized protein n=1 Tax=Verticillium dahliae TaxID=27337 RepID=A0AA44WJ46_VERDA|nr:Adenosine deaminase [Verticillium dahliae VDG2]PNH32426.1 hypothetical protein BJF96_g4200 [Verticillium dahliae]PNH53160.1 hypothetical protein VD0003_g4223 [Verticillium dahliae]PNH65627.1 hypothetical protein VD0002_g3455 [Verticillium dahliae]
MRAYRSTLPALRAAGRPVTRTRQTWARHASNRSRPHPQEGGSVKRLAGFLAIFALGAGAGAAYYYPVLFPGTDAEAVKPVIPKAQIKFEKERQQATSKEHNRDIISSQHAQVRQSWENPGVYAWGSNSGKVVDQQSKETYVKLPRRIPYFDGKLLRDVKLTQKFGVAVTEEGNLVQWGLGFSQVDPSPAETLKGKNLTKIAVSDDRILALASNGAVYAVPASLGDQDTAEKAQARAQQSSSSSSSSSSWFSFWSSGASVLEPSTIRTLTPSGLSRGEKVVDISSGLQHALLLTSKGRVFSVASSLSGFPSVGQMGVPGLSWATRPEGAFDQPHEILGLKGFEVVKIATGDKHSVALDKDGKVFTFGDNTFGQLGLQSESGFQSIDVPSLMPVPRLYANTGLVPRVTSIAAGGLNSFFTVDATPPAFTGDGKTARTTADTWACGSGILGTLGTGKWTHVSSTPVKIKSLSGLSEYDEVTHEVVPIRLADISVGSTHAAATMANVTYTGTTARGSDNDTNWGADVVFWGGNEHYQLGTGKRSNANAPTYIRPLLDGGAAGDFHRFQLTPRKTVRLGGDGRGRKASVEQRVACGRMVTAVYSAA